MPAPSTSLPFRLFSIVSVSAYLGTVGTYLLLRNRLIVPSPLRKIIAASFKKPYAGAIQDFAPETGHCYLAQLPTDLVSDQDGWSRMIVFEDGVPLTRPHASHQEVRETGNGAYSHWGNWLYFSTRDNSDPRTNGRKYTVRETK